MFRFKVLENPKIGMWLGTLRYMNFYEELFLKASVKKWSVSKKKHRKYLIKLKIREKAEIFRKKGKNGNFLKKRKKREI